MEIKNTEGNMEYVNNSQGIPVDLVKKIDSKGQPYYTGMLRFNGILDFEGTVFMIFLSEEGYESMQISVLDESKRRDKSAHVEMDFNRTKVDLDSFRDKDKNVVYIAQVDENIKLHMKQGVFFTVFTSVEGREQLHISPLRQRKTIYQRDVKDVEIEHRNKLTA